MKETFHRTEGDINLSDSRKEWYKVINHADTQHYLDRRCQYFIICMSTPAWMQSCEGIYITDLTGKSYMDFHGNNVHQVGYRNAYVLDKVKAQMDILPFSPAVIPMFLLLLLAKKLAGLFPR